MQKIYDIAEAEKIYIAYDDLGATGDIWGLYTIHPQAGPIIILDQSLLHQPKLHRCIAAHELGHHFYPPRSSTTTIVAFCRSDYTNSQKEIVAHQDENRALRWATELLMPSREVWAAAALGCTTLSLLAEAFGVCEWFVRFKIGYLRRRKNHS